MSIYSHNNVSKLCVNTKPALSLIWSWLCGFFWTRCQCFAVLSLIWSYAFLWSLLVFIPDVATFNYSERMYTCVDTSNVDFLAINASLVYFPCVAVIVVCYACIFVAVRQTRIRVFNATVIFSESQGRTANGSESKRLADETRLAIQLLFIVVVFVACWTPYLMTNVLGLTDTVPVWLSNLFVVSIEFNAAVNPIVYLAYNRIYRHEVRRIVFRWWPPPTSLLSIACRKRASRTLLAIRRHHRLSVVIPLPPRVSPPDAVALEVVKDNRPAAAATTTGLRLDIIETRSTTIHVVTPSSAAAASNVGHISHCSSSLP